MDESDLHELIENANNGDVNACYELGNYLLKNDGASNTERAIELLTQAVSGEHAGAMLLLGEIYFYGEVVPKDKRRGGKLIEQAAIKGHIPAQRVLGDLLIKAGHNKPELITHGLNWLRCAAENGDLEARYILGKLYLNGDVVQKDTLTVFEHLIPAADAGYQPARDLLNKHFNYKENQEKTERKFVLTLNKIPKHFPEPCRIVFLHKGRVDADIKKQTENDSHVFGIKIKKTALLEKEEFIKLSNALQQKDNYDRGGIVCFEADIAFIFGEDDDQVRVLIDLQCGWTYIKYDKEFLDLGINWQSESKLKYHEIAKELRAKYFSEELINP